MELDKIREIEERVRREEREYLLGLLRELRLRGEADQAMSEMERLLGPASPLVN